MKRIPATAERATEAWKHIPLVKLGEILKQMIWFSGDYILNISKDAYECRLKGDNVMIPQRASLDIQYRKQQITIKCIWETRELEYDPYNIDEKYPDRFAIGISEPYHRDFQIPRWRVANKIRYTHSRYYSIAIDRIEDAIYNAQKVIDEEIAAEEEVRKQLKETKEIKKELCKNLDVKITSENMELFYREDSQYRLHFQMLESGLYEIGCIGGEYTEAEIKKMIEIVGGNPRAIAERLSK